MSNHIKKIEVVYTDNNWRILCYNHGVDGTHKYYNMEHDCPMRKPWGPHDPGWSGFTATIHNRGMLCNRCSHNPIGGIQALFWFLKEQRTEYHQS
jgi:hypothetical protein